MVEKIAEDSQLRLRTAQVPIYDCLKIQEEEAMLMLSEYIDVVLSTTAVAYYVRSNSLRFVLLI